MIEELQKHFERLNVTLDEAGRPEPDTKGGNGPSDLIQAQVGSRAPEAKGSNGSSRRKMILDALKDSESPEPSRLHEELIEYLWDRTRKIEQPASLPDAHPAGRAPTAANNLFRKAILDSLAFDAMRIREEDIPQAYSQTFSWIFQRDPIQEDGQQMWSSFPEWLEGDCRLPYWITGKPGSGKSTLVKFILQHDSLREHIQAWVGGSTLLITSYYAWIAGSSMQKSRDGLMRTLLYQILQERPMLISTTTPRRWALLNTLRGVVQMPAWESWEVEESFWTLLAQCSQTMKLVVFVDGLDEFELLPKEIVELVRRIGSHSGIKICVASRPWTDFHDAFNDRMLLMQNITTPDISRFVKLEMENNPGFLELRRINPDEASQLLIDIVKKSDGVFLWVSLVVKTLLAACTEGDGLQDLRLALESLPGGIAELYDAIWSRINPSKISESSQLLMLLHSTHEPLHYLTLWLAIETKPLDVDFRSFVPEKREAIRDNMRRRLASRTLGLLETSKAGSVNFFHRTARDWVAQPKVLERISSSIQKPFDPYLILLEAETLRTADKSYFSTRGRESLWEFVDNCLYYASQVEDVPESRKKLVRALDTFDEQFEKIFHGYANVPMNWRQLHWCSFQTPQEPLALRPPNVENTFTGLAAQFCIILYLRAVSTPVAIKNRVSLLENAVMGYRHVTAPTQNPVNPQFHIAQAKRLETIAFILKNGASPKQIMTNGVSLISLVREMKRNSSEPNEESYWDKVEVLLTQQRSEKLNFRSFFRSRRK